MAPLSFPELPDDRRVDSTVPLRYEDVTQHGRLRIMTMTQVFGPTLWTQRFAQDPVLVQCWRSGVIPVMTRLVVEGGDGPIAPTSAKARVGYGFAHGTDPGGAVNRVVLQLFAEIEAPKGSLYPPVPPGAGTPLLAGRVYGEDTFTRLFGPPEERRVTSLAFAGLDDRPGEPLPATPAADLLAIPEGATALDAEWHLEPPLAFGLDDTDANQHVNSMVTPQRFLEAVMSRLATHGVTTALSARRVEVRYRKPSFAGERVRIGLRTYSTADGFGAVGFLTEADAPDPARPRAAVSLTLS